MHLNSLTANPVEYKSGNLPIALYPNVMREKKDGKTSFYARVMSREHLFMEDIADDMVIAGVDDGMTKEQILSIWKKINCAILDRVSNGCTVDTGLGQLSAKVSGSFRTESESFCKDHHVIDMAFRTSRNVRQKLGELGVVIRQGNATKPDITDVKDMDATVPGTLTRGGFLELKGRNIKLFGDDESVGLYFVSEDDPAKTVKIPKEKIGFNSSTRLACVVPPKLQAGRYRIKLVTQYMRTNEQRKTALSTVYGRVLELVEKRSGGGIPLPNQ